MHLEHISAEELKRDILGVVGRYLDLSAYKVFFFGSRVSGESDERSDVDVGIEGTQAVPLDILYQELWLAMTDWRNEIVHQDGEAYAEELYARLPEVCKLFEALEARLASPSAEEGAEAVR